MTEFEATARRVGSAWVETGVVIHDGQRFEALGSVVDTENGVLIGYPKATDPHAGKPPYWTLNTWGGEPMYPLVLVRTRRVSHVAGRYTGPFVMHYWRATIDGVRYSGRNSGPGMALKLRAGKRVAS